MKTTDDSHLEVILNSIADGVFTISQDKTVTSFNRAAEQITGIPREKAVGKKCFDLFQSNICQTACALEESIKTGKQFIDLKVNILDSRGETIPVSISTAVLRNRKGEVIGGVETFRDLSTIEVLKKEITKQYSFEDIVSKNHKVQQIFNILPDIAESDSTVLITGASGSGKELLARAIHRLSLRKDKAYVVVNCGALPDTLLESELFGYLKGAFTDAKKDKPGRVALAQGGTLFLDEIGDLGGAVQTKLLRFLQHKEYEPLGGTKPLKANVRIIAATNRDLTKLLAQGKFREDLYYRLNVVKIQLPPLSQRQEDIPYLVDHFIRQFNLKTGKHIQSISAEVMNLLMKHDFPGNVRELENMIEYAFVLCRGSQIVSRHLPQDFLRGRREEGEKQAPERTHRFAEAEEEVIRATLARHKGSRAKAAHDLGIHVTTLWRKMKRLGIADL